MTPAAPDAHALARLELRGRVLALFAGAVWSTGGIIVRLIEDADAWQILMWRSTAVWVSLLVVLALRDRAAMVFTFRAAGWRAVAGGFALSIAFAGFILALLHTTVANALFLISTAPFISTLLGLVLLGEVVRRATWVAMLFALLGVGVMVGEGLAIGQGFGNAMGLLAACGFSVYTVALRSGGSTDMMPAVFYAGAFGALWGTLAVLWLGEPLVPPPRDLALCVLAGTGVITLGMVVYVIGARHLSAGEAALLTMSEVVLGPVWVWIWVDEVPSAYTLVGGAILLAALAGNIVSGMRRRRPPVGVV